MLDDLTLEQYSEWEAFNRISPIGGGRMDFHFAHLISHLSNLIIKSFSTGSSKDVKIDDCMPNWTGIEDEPDVMSPEAMKDFWVKFAERQNKKVTEEKEKNERKKDTK